MASKFSLDISRFVDEAEQAVEATVKTVEIELFSRIILRSPVDTGRFRGNWNVDQSSASQFTDVSGQVTLDRMTSDVLQSKVGGVTSFINALPYAEELEFGSSQQAPEGMVRITALEFGAIFDEAASKNKS